ncbi:MAG: GAF domain-containing protein, partial [Cyanobacteriota bacterium]
MKTPSDPQSDTTKANIKRRLRGRKTSVSHQPPPLKLIPNQQDLNGSQNLEQKVENKVKEQLEPTEQGNLNPPSPQLNVPKSRTLRSQLLRTILPVVLAPLAIAGIVSWGMTNYQASGRTETKLWNDAMLSSNLAGVKVKDALLSSSLAENSLTIDVARAANFDELAVPLEHVGLSNTEKIQILAPVSKAVISTITSNGAIAQKEVEGGDAVLQTATALLAELEVQKANFGENAPLGKKPSYVATTGQLQGLTIVPYVRQEGQLVLSTSFDRDGRKYSLAAVPGIDLVSVTSIDLSEIAAAGNEHGLIFVLIFLSLGAVGAGIVVSLARRWSAPLKELTGTSEQVAAGNLDAYVEPRGTTETQTLAVSFNNLVARVKDLLSKQEVEGKRLQLCADIATSARESLDIHEVFKKAVQGTQQILNAERVFIYRFNPDWSGYVVAEAVAPGLPTCMKIKVADTYFTSSKVGVELYRKGRVFVIDDIYKANLTHCHIELYERLKIKANVITPLISGDKLLGLMCTQQCSNPRTWQQSEVDFCTQVSTQLGLAIDRIGYLQKREVEAKQQEVEAKRLQLCAD